ncbi:OmpW/AlkL family protein [Pseudoalteromonas sp. T1lg48]|uniref:OmpW/AlkL family protein n=1 Tax=Pseudoalteromonas sp. T1lg48 TaxID=2077100 RepID=UPI000CF603CC|nr:OmpW family outer membrane protein [Pseudoalteromonas sp. T1lg48]
MKKTLSAALVGLLLGTSSLAHANLSNLSINVGAINVNPDSEVSKLDQDPTLGLNVDDDTQLGITIDYALNDNWVLELIAATPFSHDVDGRAGLKGASIGEVKHLPPTLLGQYHFGQAGDKFRPFVGAGINYTIFFDEEAGQDLKTVLGTNDVDVELDDSLGLAAQVGFNYALDKNWGLHGMVSYMDIDSDASVYANGVKALTVDIKIDPVVAMFGVRYSF